MPHETSFTVKTADDFFVQIVLPQYQEFLENNASARHALLAIITVYHLGDWVYNQKFAHSTRWRGAAKNARVLQYFELAEMITNGTKHFLKKDVTTRMREGAFSSAFSNAFDTDALLIERRGRVITVDIQLEKLMDFWRSQKTLVCSNRRRNMRGRSIAS